MKVRSVAIACAGLHAGVLIEALELVAETPITLFDDDPALRGMERHGRAIAGTLADLALWVSGGKIDQAIIGTANVRRLDVRRRVAAFLDGIPVALATAIHPTAFIAPSARIGAGTFVGPMAAVHTGTVIGRNVCIYTGSTIDHDNRLEDHVFVSPGVHTAGQVIVESGAYLGPGVVVANGCRVGRDSIVGAGAVVLADIPPRTVAFGTPARPVQSVDDWIGRG